MTKVFPWGIIKQENQVKEMYMISFFFLKDKFKRLNLPFKPAIIIIIIPIISLCLSVYVHVIDEHGEGC